MQKQDQEPVIWWENLSKAEKILRKIEKRARNEFLPIVGPEKGQVLVEEIRKTNPKRV
jgi:predicted O-methyltransferase YrrM